MRIIVKSLLLRKSSMLWSPFLLIVVRPDGFGSGFYQSCRHIVGPHVVDVVAEFFRGMPFPRFYTTTYLFLILKVANPSSFEKFRLLVYVLFFTKFALKFW